jgi:chromosome segregation ATPase
LYKAFNNLADMSGDFDGLNLESEDPDSLKRQAELDDSQRIVGTTKPLFNNAKKDVNFNKTLGIPKKGGPRRSTRIKQQYTPPQTVQYTPPETVQYTPTQNKTPPPVTQPTGPSAKETELQIKLNDCNNKEKALQTKVLELLKKIAVVHNATTQLNKEPVNNPFDDANRNDPNVLKAIKFDSDSDPWHNGTVSILKELYNGMLTKDESIARLTEQETNKETNIEGNNVKFTVFKTNIDDIIREIDKKFTDYPNYPVKPITESKDVNGTLKNMAIVRDTISKMLEDMQATKEEIANLKSINGIKQGVVSRVLNHLNEVHTDCKLKIDGYPFAVDVMTYTENPEKLVELLDNFVSALAAKIQELETEIESLKATIVANKAVIEDMASQLRDAEAENVALTGVNTDLSAQLKQMTIDLADVTRRLATMKTTSDGKDAEIADLQARVTGLEVERGALKTQVDALTAERDELTASLARCNSEAVLLNATISSLTAKLATANAANAANDANFSTGNAANTALQGKLKDAENANALLKNENDTLTSQVAAMKQALEEANAKIGRLQAEIGQLQKLLEKAKSEIEKFKKEKNVPIEVGEAYKLINNLKTEIAELKRKLLNAESSVVCPDTCASDRIDLDDPASKIVDIVKKIYTKYPNAASGREMSDSQLTNNKQNLDTLKDHLKDLWLSSGNYRSAPQSGRGSSNQYNVGNELVTWSTSPDWLRSLTLWIHGSKMIEARYPQNIVDSLKSNTSKNRNELTKIAKTCKYL